MQYHGQHGTLLKFPARVACVGESLWTSRSNVFSNRIFSISRLLFGSRPWCTAKCCRKMRVPQNQQVNHGNQSIQSIPDRFVYYCSRLRLKPSIFSQFHMVAPKVITKTFAENSISTSCKFPPGRHSGNQHRNQDRGVLRPWSFNNNTLDYPKHPGQQNILQ